MFNISTVRANKSIELITWQNRVVAAGGGFASNSLVIAGNFLNVLHGKSYAHKVIYLLPMLGVGINAARVPLIDKLNVGAATNVSFVDADFSQSTGLQGNGSTKYLNSLIKPSQLGASNNGGLGWWENNISFTANVEPIGCYNTASTNRYVIDLRDFTAFFPWGLPGNNAGNGGVAATNGHYYGNRSSATLRQFSKNGVITGTNTTSDATSGADQTNIAIVGSLQPTAVPWPGRCALAYMTDGTFDIGEIADFYQVLKNYLMVPTGKPQT